MAERGRPVSGELRFEVLGPVRAWVGDHELALGTPQQRAILGILLLRGGATATLDQLINGVWGPTAPRAAVGVIRSYVSRLRRVLPRGVIESAGGGYSLRATSLDLTEFARHVEAARGAEPHVAARELRAALLLWRGTPLAGVNGDYAEFERTRLTQVRLAVVEDLAAADIESGRPVEAAAALAEVIAEQPLRERPRELLMLAHYRAGRQADALAVFAQIQQLLADELGLDPGPGLREAQRRILAADPGLAARGAGGVSQLPPDLPDFTGRADEIAAIVDTLDRVPVVGIEGLAGIGKTALAVHIGHSMAEQFPDGRLFVDLRATPDPLAALLRAVGVTDLPAAAERPALWRAHTAGRRLLVVLDNADAADQLGELMPASGSAVLITARRLLYGVPYARWRTLTGLRPDESMALLERIIGERVRREPDRARELVVTLAGLPQVLAAVGARVASRPEWTLAAARDRLGHLPPEAPVQRPECGAIQGPYESALADLSPAQARAFRLLGVADGPDISLAAAAAVLDRPVGETAALLESLVDVHLLELSDVDRYYFHGPVRAFARGRAELDDGPAAVRAALTRLVRFYSGVATTA
ncbi:AfsR/SARP family transcriptional regulator [Actinophytocola sp.]|uniref:AfsR/SARP family transcriptional regulator n=1 Tax=Actinophytocola sp. TaxID=1872138 RepID=UPI002D563128|nr:BTAD domain-containing putative transcriptional regulator [Actinophytocola sp.]HYQ63619.1 BTAD domain-containing putative transcriptional regulator [Actinophytocola sp.]